MVTTIIGLFVLLLLSVMQFNVMSPEVVDYHDIESDYESSEVVEMEPLDETVGEDDGYGKYVIEEVSLDYDMTTSYEDNVNEYGVFELPNEPSVLIPIDGLSEPRLALFERMVSDYRNGYTTSHDFRWYSEFVINLSHQLYASELPIAAEDIPETAIREDGVIDMQEHYVPLESVMHLFNDDQMTRFLNLEYDFGFTGMDFDVYLEEYAIIVSEALGLLEQ